MQFVETLGVTNCNAFLGLHPNEKSVLYKNEFFRPRFHERTDVKMRTISTKKGKYKMLYFAKWMHENTNNMLVTT